MKRKYFLRNFLNYSRLVLIPLLCVFIAFALLMTVQKKKELKEEAEYTLANVNTSLDLVISNIIFQNDQMTNNSYMLLSLRKLLSRSHDIAYSEAIYLRNIKTLFRSITQTYPYVDSLYLYLDEYDNYFSSDKGVSYFDNERAREWLDIYQGMQEEEKNCIVVRTVQEGSQKKVLMTVFQRMLLLDGIVVMDVDLQKYIQLLEQIMYNSNTVVMFYNSREEYLFKWDPTSNLILEGINYQDITKNGISGEWCSLEDGRYMIQEQINENYGMKIVSVVSEKEVWKKVIEIAWLFFMIMGISVMVMLFLAYRTAKESFDQIENIINIFQKAEQGCYPGEPRKEVQNEYDVVLNNIIYLFLHNVQLKDSLQKKQQEQEVAELTALQLQINPHFLFNTLQNVEFEVRKQGTGAELACRMIRELSDILQYALKDPMEKITLRQEIEYLKRYVSIQRMRFGNHFIVYYEVDDDLWDFPVFRLMLQPLVENSILHGVRMVERQGYIKINIFRRKERIIFRVVDNGQGMTKKEVQEFRKSIQKMDVRHIGLSNVNSRLRIYYGEEACIRVRSHKNMGCVVEFSLPEAGESKAIKNQIVLQQMKK